MESSQQQSSATAAVDPDRITIQYFENGGANPQKDPVALAGNIEDNRFATFSIKNEDHTLGNALRYIISRNPDVEFVGYSIPHPSEAKIHLRIQSRGPPAIDILRQGLEELKEAFEVVKEKFVAAKTHDTTIRSISSKAAVRKDALPYDYYGLTEKFLHPEHNFEPSKMQALLNETPYFVERTLEGKNLPVYTEYRRQGTTVKTIIRRIYGDVMKLKCDLATFIPANLITVRPDLPAVTIRGNHASILRKWLTFKGF